MASVLVMGAGAIGSYYGALLARAGHDLTLIARGEHLAALQAAGAVTVAEAGGERWDAPCRALPAPAGPPPELALITTKSQDTAAAAAALGPVLGDGSLVLSLQNGVENVALAERSLGPGRVLAGQAFVGVWIDEPGIVVHGAEGRVGAGDPAGGISAPARHLGDLIGSAWDLTLSADIVTDQWRKLLWNAGFNALCAVTGRSAGEALESPQGAALVRAAMTEVVALAATRGIVLTEADVSEMAATNPVLRDYRPSTARDLERGKRVEREALCGFVADAAAAAGIPAPVNRTLDTLLRLREAGARHGPPPG